MRRGGFKFFVAIFVILFVAAAALLVVQFSQQQRINSNQEIPSITASVTPVSKFISPTPPVFATNWKTHKEDGFFIMYPSDWDLEGTVFMKVNYLKVAELAPGYLTLKNMDTCDEYFKIIENGDGTIEAHETTVSAGTSQPVMERKKITLIDTEWEYVATKVNYEGGYPNWGGTWYPYMFCTSSNEKMFLMNFYSEKYPSNSTDIYKKILSTFQFVN